MTDREAYIAGLRKLADLLEANDDLQVPYTGSSGPINVIPLGEEAQRQQIAAWARLLTGATTEVRIYDDSPGKLDLNGTLAGLNLSVITERNVTKEIARALVPDKSPEPAAR